ncbi:YeiH family protein [Photorhabdus bodei]|uniref:YeiH family putative sulfate export transporter n=1 Tax=Photorhabdus bodei TaxID=2029681 RepID=A0A329XH93_9GAMM|nr:YeiH family protein [Photorhabdus bodei]NDK97698.1 YeiH family putative sulfate export transporter [Photorhabdus bodei]NDL01947.1 YeiH family putative sulfate export transporter [Photorhabdus bodei]NDL06021.1 YeiH family putative sulfate export transporter [Photorhabdus bodei]RAX14218.1 YeiH family putative sulfate export transporter [Photorhabdus bodei]
MSDIRAKKFSKQSSIPGMKLILGLILAAILTAISIYAGNIPWFINMGLGTLTLAILAGIIAGNTVYPLLKPYCDEGIHFSKHYLLRAGIILYGFRLTFQQIADVGITGLLIDAAMLSSTFFIAMWLGKSLFGLDQQTVILIGAGSSICGAAAIMATEPVVNAPASKVAVAVSTIVIFGTIAIFIYPWFYQLNEHYQWLPLTQETFGIFTGSTLHEVAQVVAVGHAISDQTENAAVISKMIRVMMLAPFLLLLSRYISRAHTKNGRNHQEKTPMTIPWFAVMFIAIAGFNSFNLLPAAIVNSLINIDTIMLTMAMGALGLTTHVSAIRQAGFKPILLALILFVWLMAGGLLINLGIQHLFG